MPQLIRQILLPLDGDGATAESVNSAFRELSELLLIQQHLPLRYSSPGTSTYRINLAVYNAVLGDWLVGGRNTGSGFVATLGIAAHKFPADWQLASEHTEAWTVTGGSAPLNTTSELFGGAVNTAGLYVVVGAGGFIARSSDGTSWTQSTPAASYAGIFRAVTWNGTVFVAVGHSAEIQTSADGITWTHRTPAAAFAGDFNAVSWDGTAFVAVGDGGEIQTSADGTTWTQRVAAPGGYDLLGVACSTEAMLAVGHVLPATNNPIMRRSLDHGVTWVTLTIPIADGLLFSSAAHCTNSDIFCVVGQYDSPNTRPIIMMGHPSTENWVIVDDPAGRDALVTGAVGSDGRRFVITADDGDVLFSSPCLGRRV
jgi:hypothetical protein